MSSSNFFLPAHWTCTGNGMGTKIAYYCKYTFVYFNLNFWYTFYWRSTLSYVKWNRIFIHTVEEILDRLCGLVVRVPGCRYRDPGVDSRRYQVYWEVVGLERDPVSLVSTIEELLGRNSSCSGLENREYGRGDLLHWPRDTTIRKSWH
jgi:hypothetical protein